MALTLTPSQVRGLPKEEYQQLENLVSTYNYHLTKNERKSKYYEGHIRLNDVNLGIALPDGMRNLEIGCEWGAKCVDVLAARSMFDGFVGTNGSDAEVITQIMQANRLEAEYAKACRDELKYGCTFATLSADDDLGCRIRFHSPMSAAGLWNGEKGRIGAGLAILDSRYDESDRTWKPSIIRYDTDYATWVLTREGQSVWTAEEVPHDIGRPLIEPLIWNATMQKPFGRSRIKEPVRRLIEGYVRTMANATIALEFGTTPQKYLLGITDDQFDEMQFNKFKTYAGSILLGTNNTDTGEKPTFGQLSQGSIEPHVQMMRTLATQFSAATGLTVTDTGVVNDANPTSSEAILAQTQTLVSMAEQLNKANGDSLKVIALIAEAIAKDTTIDNLDQSDKDIMPHFKNPAMPSVAVTADAAIKIASSRPEFASTDVYLEMIGFDQADIRRIKAQESRVRGEKILKMEFSDEV